MPPKPTIAIDSPTLLAVLGKELDDPIVQSVLNKSGKTKVQKPGRDGFYAFAKEAGYTLQFRPIPRAPKGTAMVVDMIILHSEGEDGNRGFAFPFGLEAAMLAADVRAQHGVSLAAISTSMLFTPQVTSRTSTSKATTARTVCWTSAFARTSRPGTRDDEPPIRRWQSRRQRNEPSELSLAERSPRNVRPTDRRSPAQTFTPKRSMAHSLEWTTSAYRFVRRRCHPSAHRSVADWAYGSGRSSPH